MFKNAATILPCVQPLSMTSPMENPDVVMPMSEFIRMTSRLNIVNQVNQVKPEKIYYKDKHTTVIWNDGTTTTVACGESETFDKYSGFCAALAKKMFSSTTHVKRMMRRTRRRLRKQGRRKRKKPGRPRKPAVNVHVSVASSAASRRKSSAG